MRTGDTDSSRALLVQRGAVLISVLVAVLGILLGNGHHPYLLDVLKLGLAYALFAVSWDAFCGLTGETSFGHTLLIGSAAYATALLQSRLAVPPVLAACGGALVGGIAGSLLGSLTLRQTGSVFAMVTMAAQLTFHRSLFIWSGFFGGEEGILLRRSLANSAVAEYLLVGTAALAALFGTAWMRRTGFGLRLRASGQDSRVGLASGVPVARVRVAGFALSGLLAGLGGSLLVGQTMVANQEMAGDALAGLIFVLAVIGGTGTLIGPWLAAFLYVAVVRESLTFLGEAGPVVTYGLLLVLVWVAPDGVGTAVGHVRRWARRGAALEDAP